MFSPLRSAGACYFHAAAARRRILTCPRRRVVCDYAPSSQVGILWGLHYVTFAWGWARRTGGVVCVPAHLRRSSSPLVRRASVTLTGGGGRLLTTSALLLSPLPRSPPITRRRCRARYLPRGVRHRARRADSRRAATRRLRTRRVFVMNLRRTGSIEGVLRVQDSDSRL